MTASAEPERFRRQAISMEEAQRRILEHVRPLETEYVALQAAWGRRSCSTLRVPHPFPPYRRSAMDGYAVRAQDLPKDGTDEPVGLLVVESLPAGTEPKHRVGPGQAARIMTGGMVPEGADTVVMLEMTADEKHDGREYVRISKSVPQGRNIADIGSELRTGETLLEPGRLLAAGEIGLLAAFGFAEVPVVRRPRVAVLSTGSELLAVDQPLSPGKIRNSNAPMLAALLCETGAEPMVLGHVPDDAEEAERLIRDALAASDMMMTTGGVSVGDSDILVDILARWEGVTLYNKVAMRPGSPTTAAILNGKPLLALSGNPGACFVGFHLFAVPALRAMMHAGTSEPAVFRARLATAFHKVNAYPRYIRSRMETRDGSLWVRPTGEDQSSLMKTIEGADCLLIIPPTKHGLEEGDLVTAISLREGLFG